MPCGKESSPRIAIGRKLLMEDPSCEAVDMTALETFTTASKQPLTTGHRPDMTAICAFRPSKPRLRTTLSPVPDMPTRARKRQSPLPALQRLDQRLRFRRIPFRAALDSGDFAPI